MSAKLDGGPAFPRPKFWPTDGEPDYDGMEQGGMSLRDYFAGQVLDMASHDLGRPDEIAERAYAVADAMLAERAK